MTYWPTSSICAAISEKIKRDSELLYVERLQVEASRDDWHGQIIPLKKFTCACRTLPTASQKNTTPADR
jgi:hypothetical protein